MLDFLKRFGLGIVYVVASPFCIAFLVLWLIYDIFVFFTEIIKGIISFFKGKKFFAEFDEDIKAKEILNSLSANSLAPQNPSIIIPNNINNIPNSSNTLENDFISKPININEIDNPKNEEIKK